MYQIFTVQVTDEQIRFMREQPETGKMKTFSVPRNAGSGTSAAIEKALNKLLEMGLRVISFQEMPEPEGYWRILAYDTDTISEM